MSEMNISELYSVRGYVDRKDTGKNVLYLSDCDPYRGVFRRGRIRPPCVNPAPPPNYFLNIVLQCSPWHCLQLCPPPPLPPSHHFRAHIHPHSTFYPHLPLLQLHSPWVRLWTLSSCPTDAAPAWPCGPGCSRLTSPSSEPVPRGAWCSSEGR